jgi:hypothetical protein
MERTTTITTRRRRRKALFAIKSRGLGRKGGSRMRGAEEACEG